VTPARPVRPADPATPGLHHVTLVARDALKTIEFYRDVLGLAVVKRTVNFDEPSSYHLYFGVDGGRPGTLLTFFEWPRVPRGGFGVGGVHHVALSVPDRTALLRWKRRLDDHHIHVRGPYDRGYFTSIYFVDPDGQILELATEGPGYAIDEPADRLGEQIVEPPLERLSGHRDEDAIAAEMHPEPVRQVDAEMAITGLHHVSGITDDIERADAFLTGTLGLRRVKRTLNQDDGRTAHWFWAAYDGREVAPASSFSLFHWPGSDYRARPGFGQTHHVAFRVPDRETQLAWRERILELGVPVTHVQERKYFRSIYFRMHDGMLLELATDGPGFDVDEPLDRLGSALQLPGWLEPRRAEIERSLRALP